MNHRAKTAVLVACDVACLLASIVLAFLLRFDFRLTRAYPFTAVLLERLPALIAIRLACYSLFRLYGRLWQFASLRELMVIVCAGTLASVGDIAVLHLLWARGFPRSVTILMWLFNIILVGSVRLAARVRRELLMAARATRQGRWMRKTLIAGAGEAGTLVARELRAHPELRFDPAGFVDDAPSKQGFILAGLPVLGTCEQIPRLVAEHDIDDVIIAMPSAPGAVVRRIVKACEGLDVRVRTLPGIYELINGKVDVTRIRDVQIEDLLRREQVKVDLESIGGYLTGRSVLVTGAGGSIGSELCRQISRFSPQKLVLVGHGENDIYDVHMELQDTRPGLLAIPVVADVRDAQRVERVFERHKPDVVFHAAAHKHVPLMEDQPDEAISNNVLGTWNLASAADKHGVSRFVLISTDKAVDPASVMGSTKRAAELLVQSLNRRSKTRFMAVRFGNVLGSRGSVVPLFLRQIARGGPLTITHPDMTRYFMTIPEAVQLVIQAGAMGEGGEVFVLDMGDPVRIVDLARDLIRLAGLDPDRDIDIDFTGIRPGEKLSETLLSPEEVLVATNHGRIFVAKSDVPLPFDGGVESFVDACRELAAAGEAGGREFVALVRSMTTPGKKGCWA